MNVSDDTPEVILLVVMFSPKKTTRPSDQQRLRWAGKYNQIYTQLSNKDEHMSHEKKPGCLGYIEGYTTQLSRDYDKPI